MSSPRVAFVTGAHRGIGAAIATALTQRGFRVYRGSRHPTGSEAHALALDVTEARSVDAAAAAFGAQEERLDVLVNNAGILLDDTETDGPGPDTDKLVRSLDVNVLGIQRVTTALLPYLRAAGQARIVNISSRAGWIASASGFAPTYSISKTAVNALTKQQAVAFAPMGITVNCCCPGWVRSDMGGANAELSLEEGADTPVWLAAEYDGDVTGGFFYERKHQPW